MVFLHGLFVLCYILFLGVVALGWAMNMVSDIPAVLLVIWAALAGHYHATQMELWEASKWTS